MTVICSDIRTHLSFGLFTAGETELKIACLTLKLSFSYRDNSDARQRMQKKLDLFLCRGEGMTRREITRVFHCVKYFHKTITILLGNDQVRSKYKGKN